MKKNGERWDGRDLVRLEMRKRTRSFRGKDEEK